MFSYVEMTRVTKNTGDSTFILTKCVAAPRRDKIANEHVLVKKGRIVLETKPGSQTSVRHLQKAAALTILAKLKS